MQRNPRQPRFDFDDYRRGRLASENVIVSEVLHEIELSDDLTSASHHYALTFTTTGKTPETDYQHEIPSDSVPVSSVSAADSEGGLQFELGRSANGKTPLKINFRNPVETEEGYSFLFSYRIGARHIIKRGPISTHLVYDGFNMFDVACERLRIKIISPRGFVATSARPSVDISSKPIEFEYTKLRPLELFSFLVLFQKRGFTRKAAGWLGSVIGSGLIGALLSTL